MIIDLTHPIIQSLPVFPGDDETHLAKTRNLERDHYNNYKLDIGMHSGTHIDGPMHLTDRPEYISEYPLETFIADGCIIDVRGRNSIDYQEKYEQTIQEGSIVLLCTGHSRLYGKEDYFSDYPVITAEFAGLLARKQVLMLGMDTPSPDKVPYAIHKYLFRHNILIIENLTNLQELLKVDRFEVIALPLRIRADSSIARVVARVR